MKQIEIFVQGLERNITFYIGNDRFDNVKIIDESSPNDLWFHAKTESSCHVIALLPENLNKKDLKYIIKRGAILCKENTNKLKNKKNIGFVYTYIKNIEQLESPGSVHITNEKTIIL